MQLHEIGGTIDELQDVDAGVDHDLLTVTGGDGQALGEGEAAHGIAAIVEIALAAR